eukprot:TRINITY_DN14130_c0_g1_i3.p1 TRINITY_DN14130_c0_g1~~TRINITY_DN14130_c0_g1_i3.p1  ORF type:complete len:209 (-),score=87.69 TRINITY_DN14130_c0_g1_i3:104-730(-)
MGSEMCIIFFFQAEDGIRDLVRSRGLGDVYKRQSAERLKRLGETNQLLAGLETKFAHNQTQREQAEHAAAQAQSRADAAQEAADAGQAEVSTQQRRVSTLEDAVRQLEKQLLELQAGEQAARAGSEQQQQALRQGLEERSEELLGARERIAVLEASLEARAGLEGLMDQVLQLQASLREREEAGAVHAESRCTPVSYTHLTLPTKRIV